MISFLLIRYLIQALKAVGQAATSRSTGADRSRSSFLVFFLCSHPVEAKTSLTQVSGAGELLLLAVRTTCTGQSNLHRSSSSCPGQHCANKRADVLCAARVWSLQIKKKKQKQQNTTVLALVEGFFSWVASSYGPWLGMDRLGTSGRLFAEPAFLCC